MSPDGNELGEFLRASRGRLSPADVGFAAGASGRRVAGLRREEVAVLAGVSVDYYARLEQGRERHPSPAMIGAIAGALRLDVAARGHVHRLAGLAPWVPAGDVRAEVHPDLMRLLDTFPMAAAYVLGPALDVLAANSVAEVLLSPFGDQRSMPRILFTHPDARTVFAEWPTVARSTVHVLRLHAGQFPNDARIRDIVTELTAGSDAFRALWAEQAVAGLTRAFKVFVHPDVGRVELTYQSFVVSDAPGQQLLVGTPASASRSEEAVAYLASMAALA